jgi:hypothetical protein
MAFGGASEGFDYVGVVAKAKSDLEAAGKDLSGPCGAFEITNLTVWRLQNVYNQQNAGILEKHSGNNCRGYSVDVVVFKNGEWYDCLINAETENTPAWQSNPEPIDDISRWSDPEDPDITDGGGNGGEEPIPPNPIPVPPQPQIGDVLFQVALRAHSNGKFVSAQDPNLNEPLKADRDDAGWWETYDVVYMGPKES